MGGPGMPLFLSEYGIGSAVDLWRTTRHFEQLGKTEVEDAQFYRDKLDRFLADWKRWKLDELYARPEDFFVASLRKMAGQRTLGLNAIRSNPNIVGYNLTGMNDHVSCGEGLTTTFRELKPGTVDAIFEGFAPLRLCLFAEPVNVYRGTRSPLRGGAGQRRRTRAGRLSGAAARGRPAEPAHLRENREGDRREGIALRRAGIRGRRCRGWPVGPIPVSGVVRARRRRDGRRDGVLRGRSGGAAGGQSRDRAGRRGRRAGEVAGRARRSLPEAGRRPTVAARGDSRFPGAARI